MENEKTQIIVTPTQLLMCFVLWCFALFLTLMIVLVKFETTQTTNQDLYTVVCRDGHVDKNEAHIVLDYLIDNKTICQVDRANKTQEVKPLANL